MATRIPIANGVYDLSEIKTAAQLREEIELLKASLKKDEHELESHLKKMPQEALKASADAILPSFINKMIANGSWKILTSGAGLLVNPFSRKIKFGKQILGGAKKLGMLAVLKGAYSMWRNKKTGRSTESLKPATLKTVKTTSKPKLVK
jgi:hypothetical protein